MKMKIKLPNPDEYDGDYDSFLEQLELCIHHARKSWEKMKKDFSPKQLKSNDDSPYITFRVNVLQDDYDKYFPILDSRKEQDIDIEINS